MRVVRDVTKNGVESILAKTLVENSPRREVLDRKF